MLVHARRHDLGARCPKFSGLMVAPATFFPFWSTVCLHLHASTMPSRPMNKGRSNDHDFVPPTQYKPSRTRDKPPGFSPLKLIPGFKAMDLNRTTSSSQLPETIDSSSPEALFTLFFTTSVIDRIVRCTNVNAEKIRADPVASRAKNIRFHDSYNQRPWKPVTSSEILAYLGILIYMGIHVEPFINNYWNIDGEASPVHRAVRNTMGQTRWKQIHRYFHVWEPALDLSSSNRTARPHEKVDPLAKLLLPAFQQYWKPTTDVAIDECIEGFTGRTADTVNIPTKPTPIGFKIWVLGDKGYVFDLLWHVKGDGKDEGPQGLRATWEKQGFSKTQAVVLELMSRMPNQGKGHAVHLDNLFTSSKLLTTLRQKGIGAAGTVRTGQTRREVNDEKRQGEQSSQALAQDDAQDELALDDDQDELALDVDFNGSSAVRQQLDLVDEIRQDMHTGRVLRSQSRSQGRTTRAKKPEKEKNFGMNEKLVELKTKWSNHIAWGELYGCLSSDKKVLQLAWKDAQIVLFMTTLVDAHTTVSRLRKRPNKKDKWIKQTFGDEPVKRLEIPDFIDMYNHLMNGVDRADQIRTYYRVNRGNYRTWKPLWNYLFQTTICNAALIWMDKGNSTKKQGGHLKFRTKLASQLMANSSSSKHTTPVDGFGVRTNLASHVTTDKDGCGGTHEVLSRDGKPCKACMAQSRTAQKGEKRKALSELSGNSVRINEEGEKSRKPRAPRTKYGCSVCQIHLCQGGTCWEEHIQLSKLVD